MSLFRKKMNYDTLRYKCSHCKDTGKLHIGNGTTRQCNKKIHFPPISESEWI